MLRLLPWAYMAPLPLIGSLADMIGVSSMAVPGAMQEV